MSQPQRESPSEAAKEFTTASIEQTRQLGEQLGRCLRSGDVVALYGELGSGKTTLIQGVAKGVGVEPDRVKSPTFVLQREYPGATPLIHIDGYRLQGGDDVAWLDTELMFAPSKITVIEWAERFEGLLPAGRLEIRLQHVSANRRKLTFRAVSPRAEQILRTMSHAVACD